VVNFQGASYRMLPRNTGEFWLVVGVPLDAPTGPEGVRSSTRDVAGNAILSSDSSFQVVSVERPVDYLALTDDEAAVTTPEAYAQEAALRGLQFAQFDTGAPRWTELFLRPVDGEITTYFGQGRSINGGPVGAFHTGVDLANDEGTPVQATAPGRVAWTGAMPIRGNSVIVDHGGGAKTGYHHLSAVQVDVGQQLERGATVGLVGHTGLATGPHLHWELTLWGVNVDPMTWLTTSFGP
jgi:murein DD-endopeptidase MepM/ murein hydrolase activator NlpD